MITESTIKKVNYSELRPVIAPVPKKYHKIKDGDNTPYIYLPDESYDKVWAEVFGGIKVQE